MKNTITLLACFLSLNLIFGQTKEDEKAICCIVDDMAKAWTNANGAGFAQHFTEEHEFFVWNGLYTSDLTKERNAQMHQHLFNTSYRDTKHYAVVDKIRFVTNNVAVVLVMSAVVPKSDPIPEHPQVLWSATLVKSDGAWKIASFHNADIEILDNAVTRSNSPIPISVMYKSWYEADLN